LVLEVPKNVPPTCNIPEIESISNFSISPSIRPNHPFLIPYTSYPYLRAFLTIALIAAFKPGASPPPVSTPILLIAIFYSLILFSKKFY